MAKLKNIHTGEILLEEFLVPLEISQNALARAISVPPRRINDQWRICFKWKDGNCSEVGIVDYH